MKKISIPLMLLVVAALILPGVAALALGELDVQRADAHKGRSGLAGAAAIPTERVSGVECVDGFALEFSCDGLDLLSFVPYDEFVGVEPSAIPGISDVWGWTDPESGSEYVILGVSNGPAFFDVTDPLNPVYLGRLPNTAAAQLIWYDIKVVDHYALVVSESAPHNLRVFDLHELRDGPSPTGVFVETGRYVPNVSAHNIVVNEDTGTAYLVGGNIGIVVPDQCSAGLHAVDVLSNPTAPTFLGCYGEDAYIHDAQCVVYDGPDTEHQGKELCFNSNEDTFSVADVTDMSAPTRIGLLEYPQTGYTHQGWLTEDQSYFLLGDETDEQDHGIKTRTLIIDVRDLDNPKLVNEFLHETDSIDHNMYVRGDLVYQSNYTSGLRVFDLSQVASGQLIPSAHFDTYPEHDDATFDGTWSNYPYFASGTIAVSGIAEGLFLLGDLDAVGGGTEPTEPTTEPSTEPATDDAAEEGLPATGGGLAVLGLTVMGGAVALRRRG